MSLYIPNSKAKVALIRMLEFQVLDLKAKIDMVRNEGPYLDDKIDDLLKGAKLLLIEAQSKISEASGWGISYEAEKPPVEDKINWREVMASENII